MKKCVILSFTIATFFCACKKEKQSQPMVPLPPPPPGPVYGPPVANAGTDKIVVLPVPSIMLPDSIIMLDGKNSYPMLNLMVCEWRVISGPNQPVFYPNKYLSPLNDLADGDYSFELKVTDVQYRVARDSVNIKVIHDTLGGKEYIFNRTWQDYNDGTWAYAFVQISDSALFYTWHRMINISIQLKNSSTWIDLPRWNWWYNAPLPALNGYESIFGGVFHELNNPMLEIITVPYNFQIVGDPVKVKVKFT